MKKILFCFLLITSTGLSAQTVDEIINKYDKAIGGAEARKKIETLKMTGTMDQFGLKLPVTVSIINGKAARTELTFNGMNIIQAHNDSSGWTVNPLNGSAAVRMSPEELKNSQQQADLSNQLADYKLLGNKVELIGTENVEGVQTHKIKLTKKDGSISYYFIDAQTYILIKTSAFIKSGNKDIESETFFSDYKPVAGVLMAHTTISKTAGSVYSQITFDKIEANVAIDKSIFMMPK